MFYRIKQFFLAVFSKITKDEEEFLIRYLNEEDMTLFDKLPTHEKKHCINVAKYVIENNDNISDLTVKAALLHDIGKINSGLNPIFKGVIVIMNAVSEKLTRKLKFIRPINVYYNHPIIGWEIYKDINSDIAYIIKNHHNYKSTNNIVKIIQEADCKN